MKQNKKMSFRLRLTLITTLMLIFVGVVFTLFSLVNLNFTLVIPVQKVINSSSNETQEGGTEFEEGNYLLDAELGAEEKEITISAASINEEFNKNIKEYILLSVVFMFFVILVGAFIMNSLSGSIIRPVRKLRDEIAELEGTGLSYRITEFDAGDELNQLADSFNLLLDRLEKAFLRESRFIADAAHEIKTPLAVIRTNLDVLSLDENPSEAEYQNSFEVIEKQTKRLSSLMEELLNMAKANEYPMDQRVEVGAMIGEILDDLKPRLNEKAINLRTEMKNVTIKASAILLKHAVHNIIENAIKYNFEAGSIQIRVFSESEEVFIEVADTGLGIDPENQVHIFEPFYRVDKSRSRAVGGSGLGLAIALEAIEQHGGSLEYRENRPQGSIFIIILPFDISKSDSQN